MAEAVRELRHAYGLSQEKFAEQVRCSLGSIARYETGGMPSADMRYELALFAGKIGRDDLGVIFLLKSGPKERKQ